MTKYLDPKLQVGATTITGVKRTNLVANPSFEVDTSSWSTVSSGTFARSLSYAFSGSFCLAYTATSAGNHSVQTTVPVSALTPYAFSAYVFTTTAHSVYINVTWLDSTSTLITNLTGGTFTSSTTGATRVTLATTGSGSTSPANTAYATVSINFNSLSASEVVAVDAVLVEPGKPLGSYFDGSFAGARWLGTTGKSQSELVAFDANSMAITNVSTPLANSEAANKSYVDTAVAGASGATTAINDAAIASIMGMYR